MNIRKLWMGWKKYTSKYSHQTHTFNDISHHIHHKHTDSSAASMLTTCLFSYYRILIFDECARYLCNHWELKVFLSRTREPTVILDVCLSLSRGRSILRLCIWYVRDLSREKNFLCWEGRRGTNIFLTMKMTGHRLFSSDFTSKGLLLLMFSYPYVRFRTC